MKKYLFILVLFSLSLQAQTLCQRTDEGMSNYLDQTETRLAFKNRGGLFNSGVCWWHSRLQRASAYLVEYHPELTQPSPGKVKEILRQLKMMNKIVIIPGYSDFYSFSKAHQKEVQLLLESWQREDGFLNQQWIRGISGNYHLPVNEMKTRMDKIYADFQKSPHPMWIMAQIKGIASHSFLLMKMKPLRSGYELELIDSNHPLDTRVIVYELGQKYLKHPKEKYSFVPYTGFQQDFHLILSAVRPYCGRGLGFDLAIPVGEIEVGQ